MIFNVLGPGGTPLKKLEWKITTALPEDYAVNTMKAVKDSAVESGVDLSQSYEELTGLQQVSSRLLLLSSCTQARKTMGFNCICDTFILH